MTFEEPHATGSFGPTIAASLQPHPSSTAQESASIPCPVKDYREKEQSQPQLPPASKMAPPMLPVLTVTVSLGFFHTSQFSSGQSLGQDLAGGETSRAIMQQVHAAPYFQENQNAEAAAFFGPEVKPDIRSRIKAMKQSARLVQYCFDERQSVGILERGARDGMTVNILCCAKGDSEAICST